MRAIAIDDSRPARAILRRMLVGPGFEVAGVADHQQGPEKLQLLGVPV